MINDNDVTYVQINVDDESNHFSTIYRKDDMSSLTIEGKSTIISRAKRSLSTLCKFLHTYKQKAK